MATTLFRKASFKKYFLNTIWIIADKGIRIILNIFVVVFVARYLGPDRFGLLNYAISFVWLFLSIATIGLDEIVIRNLVQKPTERDQILGTAFALKIIGSFVFSVVVVVAIQFTSSQYSTKLLVYIIAGGIIFKSVGVIEFYFLANVNARFITISQFVAVLVSSTVQIMMILLKAPVIWFAWALVLENVVFSTCLVLSYLTQRLSILKWRFKRSFTRKLLQDSLPLMLSGLMVSIYMRIDQVMIKEILNSEAVGIYAAAVYLSEGWYFIPMALTASLFPAILDARKENDTLYCERLQMLFDFLFWIALPVAILTTFFAEFAIGIIYDEKYILSAGILRIHIWTGIFVFMGVAASKFLVAENLVMVSLKQTLIGCISNIILNFVLIPSFGIKGAAIATLISQAVVVFSLIFHTRARRVLLMIMYAMFPFHRITFFTVR